MATPAHTREDPGFVGCIGLAIILGLIGWGIHGVTTYLKKPPAVVSLSAYFVDNPKTWKDPSGRHLRIQGEVHQIGEAVKDGNVQLTASKQDSSFQQTISVELKNGKFEAEEPAFSSLLPEDQISIRAEVWSSQLSDPAALEIYLNSGPPALGLTGEIIVWIVIAVLFSFFFYAFTGSKTRTKNRIAIILSYIIIGISLAVPLAAPVLLLRAFPNLRSSMIGKPAGLVVTRIGKDPGEVQWALNIGGYSTIVKPEGAPDKKPNKQEDTAAKTNPNKDDGTKQTANPGGQPGAVPPVQVPGPAPAPSSPTTSSSPGTGDAAVDKRTTRPNSEISKDPGSAEEVLKVEGGLVIPFYVIILSVIGGAINMTRKVPRLQKEGEYAEVNVSASKLAAKVLRAVRHPIAFVKNKVWDRSGPSSPVPGSGTDQGKPKTDSAPEANAADIQANTSQPGAAKEADHEQASKPVPPHQVADTPAVGETPPAGGEGKNAEPATNASVVGPTAKEIDANIDLLVKEQVQRNTDTDRSIQEIRELVQQMQNAFDTRKDSTPILGYGSFEDWLRNRSSLKEVLGNTWRVELLNQYMYLISAPFLAIVAYYMLDLLGLTKQPILVLISFSVGLISERILSWLLSMATGYLRSDTASQSATK
jgi:hypothetical protein